MNPRKLCVLGIGKRPGGCQTLSPLLTPQPLFPCVPLDWARHPTKAPLSRPVCFGNKFPSNNFRGGVAPAASQEPT